LIFSIVAFVEVDITIVVVVVHAFVTMPRLDSAGMRRIWARVVELLIFAVMACVHVNVSITCVVVKTFCCVVSRFEFFAVKEPLLVFSAMAVVHVHVVIVVVEVQALVVVIGR
jgi:hypothetical protein